MNAFELPVLYWIREHLTCPFLDWLMPPLSALSAHGEIWILLAVVLICIPKPRRVGLTMGVTLLLCLLIGNLTLKPLIARVRPYDVATDVPLLVERLHDFAFPSGHTCSSFIGAITLTWANKKFAYFAFPLAALIAFSRMYHYVHFPTDILGGIALACLVAIPTCLFLKPQFDKLLGWISKKISK